MTDKGVTIIERDQSWATALVKDFLASTPQALTAEQRQIKLLNKELEDAKLLAEGYRRMIELAEQELKISIRKKPNTK